MQHEIESYQYWHEVGFHLVDDDPVHAVVLSPTYEEWLRENPEGYILAIE